ncbi:hypothetical protein FUA23_00510 [Neolewinella aurantiaca]|uniref:Uncharacterized protein n=1 Tax=Neolewinella aurantiaca TaxID=2602767 RepID=A0A5C7FLW5_9BACT|nr:hypothetical protein [Neolewinella aurantiaca]TXF91700.1 hypothetical protein FUA23_00510 [Neolewinella aurantiaca]
MKRLLTFRAWKFFFITAGLPILSFLLGIVCIIVVLLVAGSEPSYGEDVATVLVFAGLGTGLVIFQLWAVTLGRYLLHLIEPKAWLK